MFQLRIFGELSEAAKTVCVSQFVDIAKSSMTV